MINIAVNFNLLTGEGKREKKNKSRGEGGGIVTDASCRLLPVRENTTGLNISGEKSYTKCGVSAHHCRLR
jgi:hypothetical protein